MLLQQLINSLRIKHIVQDGNIPIQGIQYDSRRIQPGDLFICLQGHTVDGHDYVEKALLNGAVAILAQQPVNAPAHIPIVQVPDTRRAMAVIADVFYASPTEKLRVIGVTGTNGKTTTTNIIQQLLNANSFQSGLIGTINIKYGGVEVESVNTTPDTLELQGVFHDMLTHDMTHVAMEVSSHALALGRTRGTRFQTAVFTNLTQDHLDYHKTIDEYAQAKGLLFSQLGNTYGDANTVAVLNADDPMSKTYAEMTSAQILTYGIHAPADIYATDIQLTPKGTSFTLHTYNGSVSLETKLIGEFNVYNMLAAISAVMVEGVDLGAIKDSIEQIEGIPGRFEAVDAGQPFAVIVDYAHTADSLENVLKTARQFTKGTITCVVGCGGDRDATKRPLMAAMAEAYSDYVVLTSDNPRSENPQIILTDMEKGMNGILDKTYSKIANRKEAIAHAILHNPFSLTSNDCIVIAGKGHENYQIIGSNKTPFDDRLVAREYLSARYRGSRITESVQVPTTHTVKNADDTILGLRQTDEQMG